MAIISEISPLKKVILHRPQDGLEKIIPDRLRDFLFEDILWLKRAQEEFDCFKALLQSNGVEVYLVEHLLSEILKNAAAKDFLINRIIPADYQNSEISQLLKAFLQSFDEKDLTYFLLNGITAKQLKLKCVPKRFFFQTLSPQDFVLEPLPNLLFMRDSSSFIGDEIYVNSMASFARKNETLIMLAIYKFHPFFAQTNIYQNFGASIEGGDIQVLKPNLLLIGISKRTKATAVENLAIELLKKNKELQILAVELPKKRATMHLDTLITQVDHDKFCTAIKSNLHLKSWTIRAAKDNNLDVRKNTNFLKSLAEALKIKKLHLVKVGDDYFSSAREQWSDACNLLALRQGTVVAYECNSITNKKLRQAGVEVLTLPSSELVRGRGGFHCLSCPVLRLS